MSKLAGVVRCLAVVLVVVLPCVAHAEDARERIYLTFEAEEAGEVDTLSREDIAFQAPVLQGGDVAFAGDAEMEAVIASCVEDIGVSAEERRACELRAANRIMVTQILVLGARELDDRQHQLTLAVYSPESNSKIWSWYVVVDADTLGRAARQGYPELAEHYLCWRATGRACVRDAAPIAAAAPSGFAPRVALQAVAPRADEAPAPTGRIELPGVDGMELDLSATGLVWSPWLEDDGYPAPGVLFARLPGGDEDTFVAVRVEHGLRERCEGLELAAEVVGRGGSTRAAPDWLPAGWHPQAIVNPSADGSHTLACRNLDSGTVLYSSLFAFGRAGGEDALRAPVFAAIEEAASEHFGAAPAPLDVSAVVPAPLEKGAPDPGDDDPWARDQRLSLMVSMDLGFVTDVPASGTQDMGYGALARLGTVAMFDDEWGAASGLVADIGYTSSGTFFFDTRLLLGIGARLGSVWLLALASGGGDQACREDGHEANAIIAGYLGYEGRLRWLMTDDLVLDLMAGHAPVRGDDTQAVRGEVRLGFTEPYDGVTRTSTFVTVGTTHYVDRVTLITANVGIGL